MVSTKSMFHRSIVPSVPVVIRWVGVALLCATAAGCIDDGPGTAPLRMEVRALGTGACEEDPGTKINPFSDMKSARVVVTGEDPQTGEYKVLLNTSQSISGDTLRVPNVPEGNGHVLEFWGTGGSQTWYAKDPNVNVKRDQDNPVELLLTKYGGTSQVGVPTSFTNVLFPAMVTLGDGRVVISGGFLNREANALTGTSQSIFIFDPKTGETSSGSMPKAMAAHAMAFMNTTGQVLMCGGVIPATQLDLDAASALAVQWDGTNSQRECMVFTPPNPGEQITESMFETGFMMRVGRVFPRMTVTSDGLVVVTGGGTWPEETNLDYRRVEVFDPDPDSTPTDADPPARFVNVSSFDTFAPRAGHSLNFIKNEDGLAYVLVWGGTPAGEPVGEVLRQSSRQASGVDGNFLEISVQGDPPKYPFFHQTVTLSGQRFLVVGGATRESDAWTLDEASVTSQLLTYTDTDGQDPVVTVQNVAGMQGARVFHFAFSPDFERVSVVGGFSGMDALSTFKVMQWDPDTGWAQAPESGDFLGRGGHGGVAMLSGSALLAGGESTLAQQGAGAQCAYVEVYTPSIIPQP